MSRRKCHASLAKPKESDLRFNSLVIAQFIKMLMRDGKKQKASNIVWTALDMLYEYCNKKGGIIEDANEVKDSESEKAAIESMTTDEKKNMYTLRVLDKVLSKAGPSLELISKRIGGANIQVPVAVKEERQKTLAMRNIIVNARKRIPQCKSMINALAQEMIDVLKGSARTLDDVEQMHRMAKANAVFQGVKRA